MISGKLLFTIMGAFLAVLAISKMELNQTPVVENWWGAGQFSTTAVPFTKINGQDTALPGMSTIVPDTHGSGKFFQPANLQAVLSPRFSNVNYGAQIKYSLPDYENLGSPCDALTFADMQKENYSASSTQAKVQNMKANMNTQENYCGGCSSGVVSCGKGGYGMGHAVAGGYELPTNYINGQDSYNKASSTLDSVMVASPDLPIASMSAMDAAGNIEQFVTYGRLMVANSKSSSPLRAQGDKIRGDLAITPCQSGWFSVYPNLNRDVETGALNVMAGTNSGNEDLMRLVLGANGGTQTTFAGVNVAEPNSLPRVNMTPDSISALSAGLGDIQVYNRP